jgi:hypothetical protein
MPEGISADWIVSILALLGFVALCVLASHKAGQPYDVERPQRLPWRLILILSAFLAALVLVHMINLSGYETGVDKGLLGRR